MPEQTTTKITTTIQVNAPISKVWDYYTNPEHIVNWSHADDSWHTTSATNDVRVGGEFKSRMAPKVSENPEEGDGGFDFGGTYTAVEEYKSLTYTMSDGRIVDVTFTEENGGTRVDVVFDPENENDPEFQRQGWQAILDNFKDYVESN